MDKAEFKILLLDNGAFHKAKRLIIPDNIALVFIPPYTN
jgi:transposase